MAGVGVEQRMAILQRAIDQQSIKPFETHGWTVGVEEKNEQAEYIIVMATKEAVVRRVALLYTSATANNIFKQLDTKADRTFTNGALYKPESFIYGLTKPVVPVDEFFPILVAWNKELHPEQDRARFRARPTKLHQIKAENPLASIWTRLDQFASVRLAAKLIRRRAADQSIDLAAEKVESKAVGLAFSLRNASDYFRALPFESLNKRILSLYYGSLALGFAEMLASPSGPSDLDEIEGYTKYGHGFYTLGSADREFAELGSVSSRQDFCPDGSIFSAMT